MLVRDYLAQVIQSRPYKYSTKQTLVKNVKRMGIMVNNLFRYQRMQNFKFEIILLVPKDWRAPVSVPLKIEYFKIPSYPHSLQIRKTQEIFPSQSAMKP